MNIYFKNKRFCLYYFRKYKIKNIYIFKKKNKNLFEKFVLIWRITFLALPNPNAMYYKSNIILLYCIVLMAEQYNYLRLKKTTTIKKYTYI